ncbi:VOC family protein [Collimonas sp.]|jgi:catechol 2,3-dioxygenase-like lactoylglutathione lyase family enzyme|uniref:VOC family protein n=1 Tax=Collimonas sp. TaxID=1963772 RepID=UPI002CA7FCAD|nr:VOC family protein [Collimonas sp.]HWX03532.1 VOC family protein [Collimonas sp.]
MRTNAMLAAMIKWHSVWKRKSISEDAMPVIGIDHLQLAMPAAHEDAARRFYGDILGLVELPKPADLAARGGVWFLCGAVQLHLGVEKEFRPARKAHPGLVVDKLAPLVAALTEAGHNVKHDLPIAGFTRIFTEDPFGNRIELLEADR